MRMRTLILALLMTIAASVSAEVPLDLVTWAPDSGKPTEAGMARRVQVYMLGDFSTKDGRNEYKDFREIARAANSQQFEYLHFLIVVGGSIEIPKEGDPKDYWCKGVSNNNGLVRAFGGDAMAVIVLVDSNGRINSISRHSDTKDEIKLIETLGSTAKPLVADASQFPLSCKLPLADLRVGDVNRAVKNLNTAGKDAPLFIKTINDRVNAMVEMDVAQLNEPATKASDKLIALRRLQKLLAEFPRVPAASAAALALKKTKDDKQLANEQAAYGVLMAYIEAMKNVQPIKAKETQLQWISGLTTKYSGTYAAEIATMIRKASRLDQTK